MDTLRLDFCRDCLTNGDNDLTTLQNALDIALSDKVRLCLSPCMEQCETPQVLTLQSKGGAGYVFTGIDPENDAPDIVKTCKAYLNSRNGWIEDARPCGRLRFCLAARLPA